MAKKTSLNKGLQALLGEVAPKTPISKTTPNKTKKPKNNTPNSEINISAIKANQYQPRTTFDEKKLKEFPDSLIILSDTMKLKNTISEGLSEIKSKSKNIPTNITTIKNFNVIKADKDFLRYGTSSKNLYLILLEKGFE